MKCLQKDCDAGTYDDGALEQVHEIVKPPQVSQLIMWAIDFHAKDNMEDLLPLRDSLNVLRDKRPPEKTP